MPIEQSSIHCQHCKQLRLHTRSAPNHLVHALVTLFLCGLWIPVWIIAASSTDPFRCNNCGVINRHLPPPVQPLRPQAIGKTSPTDWHKNLKVIGLIAGAVGGLIILSVFISSLKTPPVQQTPAQSSVYTLVNLRAIFGKDGKELDKMLGKPTSVTKGTAKSELIRNYPHGNQLLIRMKDGKSVAATLYLKEEFGNYRNVLQTAAIDTDISADNKVKINNDTISAHVWNYLSFDNTKYQVTVFKTSPDKLFNAISMEISE